MIEARVIADSISENDVRIVTFELVYPRFIHAELMTHRVFSRNSASSRAIPVSKLLRSVRYDPALPIHWGANQKGMQARKELDGWRLAAVKAIWAYHRWLSITHVKILDKLGLHKQIANRLLEAHSHIRVLVTSTLFENFFNLRAHADAQPEFYNLAYMMLDAYNTSSPQLLKQGQWHLPYIFEEDENDAFVLEEGMEKDYKLRLISAARCARVSYTTFDHRYSSPGEDFKLGLRLINADPLHASPMEHQATPDPQNVNSHLWGNFHGWIQHRKMYINEATMETSYYVAHKRVVGIHM